MKILFITYDLPCFQGLGTPTRAYHLIKSICARHSVSLICFTDAALEETAVKAEKLHSFCDHIFLVPRPKYFDNKWMLRFHTFFRSFHPLPWGVRSLTPNVLRSTVKNALIKESFDVIYIDHMEMAPLFFVAKAGKRVLGQEMVSPKLKLYYREQQGLLTRFSSYIEWKKMVSFERKTFPQVDLLIMTSDLEEQKLRNLGHKTPAAVIPNGVDTHHFRYQNLMAAGQNASKKLLYIGSLSYLPNEDAILYFYAEIWPHLKARIPKLEWDIVGKGAREKLQALACKDIRLTGFVPDAREYFYHSTVMVVPMRIGSGTRLKILEAMAAGTPVVSTTIGAEGLEVEDGRHLLLADRPEAFAAAVAQVLTDPALADHLRANARQLVEQKYDWPILADRLDQAYRSVIGNAQ